MPNCLRHPRNRPNTLFYRLLRPGVNPRSEGERDFEIIDAIWAKEFIAEGTLAQAVFELRAALGDPRSAVRYIETIPKRGYRLVAPVKPVAGAASSATT